MLACNLPQFYNYCSLSIHNCKLLNEKLAELPTILDSLYWLRQYHKYSYRGGGEPQSGRLTPNGLCKLKTAKWHQLVLVLVLAPHNTQNR